MEHYYTPTPGLPELREAIVKKTKRDSDYEITVDQVLVTNGGKQSVYQSFASILDPGDEVILPSPFWTTYPECIKLAGGVSVEVINSLRRKCYQSNIRIRVVKNTLLSKAMGLKLVGIKTEYTRGFYSSESKGLIKISSMNEYHIRRALLKRSKDYFTEIFDKDDTNREFLKKFTSLTEDPIIIDLYTELSSR